MLEPVRQDTSSDNDGYSSPHPLLSIIIPAFNEEKRLSHTLSRILSFIESQSYSAEIIVVDNASTDLTRTIVEDFMLRTPLIRYVYEEEQGKGAAARTGILAGRGDYLLISDADMAVPISEVNSFFSTGREGFDVAIGSREIKGAARYHEPFYRHLMGRVFNLIVQMLVLPGIQDTQCGFKCFRRDPGHDLFARSTIAGWSFDVEILCMARHRGYRIIEVPVTWHHGAQSKISPLRDTWHMLKELMAIRKNVKKGVY
jgi:dolichyl-phosphate beta-glucosyltransferase